MFRLILTTDGLVDWPRDCLRAHLHQPAYRAREREQDWMDVSLAKHARPRILIRQRPLCVLIQHESAPAKLTPDRFEVGLLPDHSDIKRGAVDITFDLIRLAPDFQPLQVDARLELVPDLLQPHYLLCQPVV